MRTPHPTLTPQELAIMKEVWRLDQATVRKVYEALREKRAIAYTTVMTMMKILEDKGYLKRTQVVGAMVRDFVDRVFDGAAGSLLLHLARDGKNVGRLTKDERQRIKRLMQDAEKAETEEE